MSNIFLPQRMVQTSYKIFSLQNPPSDTVSELAFSTFHELMAVSSWDSTIRIYDPSNQLGTGTNSVTNTGKPLLSCCFSTDAPSQVYAGAVDGTLQMVDLQSNQQNEFQAHTEGIKSVRYYQNMVVTASWDKTVKFWDIRSSKQAFSIDLPGKAYAMDLEKTFMALSVSGNQVITYDLNNINQKKTHAIKLNWMVRSIGCGNDNNTFAIGGIEGKCEILNITNPVKKMVFRCHRVDNKAYSVNAVSFLPSNLNIIATAGGDGSILFFDSSSRFKVFTQKENDPITAGKFSSNSQYFVYATGHDWSSGYEATYKPVNIKVVQVSTTGIKL